MVDSYLAYPHLMASLYRAYFHLIASLYWANPYLNIWLIFFLYIIDLVRLFPIFLLDKFNLSALWFSYLMRFTTPSLRRTSHSVRPPSSIPIGGSGSAKFRLVILSYSYRCVCFNSRSWLISRWGTFLSFVCLSLCSSSGIRRKPCA